MAYLGFIGGKMPSFRGDDRAADGIPVEVKLENGGYFDAFLMDIINGEALIHFPFGWMPESKYQLSQVRFPPEEGTPRYVLQEKMIAEVLVNKDQGFHEGWFKCCIQMLKSEFCQFEYLDTQNGSDFGYTCNIRKPNINPTISMDKLHVHKIIIPEDLHEYAKYVHNTFKDAMNSALVNYDADRGELVIISRNTADISRAEILEKSYLRSLSPKSCYLQNTREKLNPKLEIAETSEFTAGFTVPKSYVGSAVGNGEVHLRAAENIKGISSIQLIRDSNKFIIHGKTEEAVKEARKLLELKIELYPVLEELVSKVVGRESENIRAFIEASGAAEIFVEDNADALETNVQKKYHPLYIIGTVQAIQHAKLCIQFQIDHIYEMQRLREKKLELKRQIKIFEKTDTTPESVIFTYPETVQSTRQIVSSTNLPNCNLVELEELQNLNELLLEDYQGADDLDIILENIETGNIDLNGNRTRDTNLVDNTTTCINLENPTKVIYLEDTTAIDINLDVTNEGYPNLVDDTTRLNVSMESNEGISNILDTPITVLKADNRLGLLSINFPNYNLVELEQFQNLNELLLEDYETAVDLDVILDNIKTRDLKDNTTTDINLENTITRDINLEDTTTDINLDDTNEGDPDLRGNTTRLNVSMESNEDSSNILDTLTIISQTDNLPVQSYGDYVTRPPKEVEQVESVGLQFDKDPDFWTRDINSTLSKPVTYTELIHDETQEIYLQEEILHLKVNSSTPKCFNCFEKNETSSKQVSIQSQGDDQEPDCFLPVDDAPKDLDCIDASEDMGLEGQDIVLSSSKGDNDGFH